MLTNTSHTNTYPAFTPPSPLGTSRISSAASSTTGSSPPYVVVCICSLFNSSTKEISLFLVLYAFINPCGDNSTHIFFIKGESPIDVPYKGGGYSSPGDLK